MRNTALLALLLLGCGSQKSAFETLSLAASAKPEPSPETKPVEPSFQGKFRIFNGTSLVRSEWAPAGLPFPKGELKSTGSVAIGNARFAFKPLERWNDGTVRRAMIDYPANLQSNEEITVSYAASSDPPLGGFYPALPPMSVEAIVNGIPVLFDSWTTTFQDATRWEGISSKSIGNAVSGLNLDLYSTAWTGQKFGRVTLVAGNDWQIRETAAPFAVSDFRVRFNGVYAGPLFGYAHNVTTLEQYREFALPLAGVIGDGARWATTFTWADPAGPLEAAYAASLYPLFGYPEPETEDLARAYGLYGRVKMGTLGTTGSAYFTRQFWETHRNFWLSNCPNSPWTGHGYWTQQEGSTGGHPDWSPAPTLPDDLALSPRGIHRMLQLSLSRVRTPDHFRIGAWNQYPSAGAFNGWVSPPYRPQGAYSQHLSGSNGWSGSDDAHREENFRLRAYELTGEAHIYAELQSTGRLACLRAKPGSGYGEGRDVARALSRKTIAWLIGNDADRAQIEANLVPWAAYLHSSFPFLSTPLPGGPLYSLSILAPGMSKYGTHGFDPAGLRYTFNPFSEAHVPGTLAACARLTGIADLQAAADKAGAALARYCRDDGLVWDAIREDGAAFGARAGNLWYYPGLSAFEGTAKNISRAKGLLEQTYASSTNFDELGWLQP